MLKKYFLSNIIFLVIVNVLVKPIWVFVVDRNVQFRVGHEDYGMYNALFSLSVMLNILLDMGITNYNSRQLSTNHSFQREYLPNMIMAKLLLSGLYLAIVFIVASSLGYEGRMLYLLLLLGILQMLNSMLQYIRSCISAHQEFKLDGFLSIIDKIMVVLVCVYWIFGMPESSINLEWFVGIQIMAYLTSCLIGFIIVITRYSRFDFSQLSVSKIRILLKSSIPYALLILLMGIYTRSDSLMLERLSGATANSLYVSTYRILDVANMLGFLFAGILLPLFSRLLSQQIDISKIIITSGNILLVVSLFMLSVSIVFSEELMTLLYKDYYQDLLVLFPITISAFPAFCLMYIFATLLTAGGHIQLLLKIASIGVLVNLCLNYILISQWSELGAALSCTITQWLLSISFILFSIQRFKPTLPTYWWWRFVLFFGLCVSMSWGLHYLIGSMIWSLSVSGIGALGLAYITGLWDKNELKQYMSQFK